MRLLPTDPKMKAECRLWINHVSHIPSPLLFTRYPMEEKTPSPYNRTTANTPQINTHILPPFFALLNSQDAATQTTSSTALQAALTPLIQAAQKHVNPPPLFPFPPPRDAR